jgi:hypothetical protein
MSKSKKADYVTVDRLAILGTTNRKEIAFTKAEMASNVVWKQAQLSGGYDITAALKRSSNSNKQLDMVMPVGPNECIIPSSTQARYHIGFTVGDNDAWNLVAAGTAAPGALPAGKTVHVRPLANDAHAAINNSGFRIPRYAWAAQWKEIYLQIPNDKVLDSTIHSKARTIGDVVEHAVMRNFVSAPGSVYQSTNERNDWNSTVPDKHFKIRGQKRINQSGAENNVELTEAVPHPLLQRSGCRLFSHCDPKSNSYAEWPPGMSMKLLMQTKPSADARLKIGACETYDGANWNAAELFLQFTSCEIDYFATVLSEAALKLDRSLPILGQEERNMRAGADVGMQTDIAGWNEPLHSTTRDNARFLICDVVRKTTPLVAGSTSLQVKVNDNQSDVLPFMCVLVVENNNIWDTQRLANENVMLWNNGADDCFIIKCTPTIGSGNAEKAQFLDCYPGNDINLDLPYELQITKDAWAGTMLSTISRDDHPVAVDQACYSENSYMAEKALGHGNQWGRGFTKLPYEKMVPFICDTSSLCVRDASNGADATSLMFNVDFNAAVPDGAKSLVVYQYFKHNIVFARKPGAKDELPMYTMNTQKSRLAYGAGK